MHRHNKDCRQSSAPPDSFHCRLHLKSQHPPKYPAESECISCHLKMRYGLSQHDLAQQLAEFQSAQNPLNQLAPLRTQVDLRYNLIAQ